MPQKSHKILYGAIGLLLAVCIGLQLIRPHDRYHFKPPAPLKEYLPKEIGGWVGEDHKLGDTELMREKVESILGFDDVIFREYKKNGHSFSIYIAYWKPENQMQVEIGAHTPDICWVDAGWKIDKADHAYDFSPPGVKCWPGQYREMEAGDNHINVVFWHFVGGDPSGYSQGIQTHWLKRIPDRMRVLWANRFGYYRSEQYFIRISSQVPIKDLRQDEFFMGIYKLLLPMGIEIKSTAAD